MVASATIQIHEKEVEMPAAKRSKIIVVDDDFTASEIARAEVAPMVSGASLTDAVSMMSSETEPQASDVVHNDELNVITARLTQKEAKDLAGKPSIVAIEDDEEVFALSDNVGSDLGDLGDVPLDADTDAEAEIEAAERDTEDLTDEEAQALASAELMRTIPEFDEVEFDEMGSVLHLDDGIDPGIIAAGEATGIPRDKIVKLIKCVIQCALKELASGAATDVSQAQIEALLAQQGVGGDTPAATAIRDYITCGLRIIYAQYAWRFSTGSGVRVAVVDTGIAPRHPDLRVYGGASFVSGTSWADDNGHGTHVAGTIAGAMNNRGVVGVAPYARLYAVKVLNASGSGSTSGVLSGLAWCYRYGMHVVNLSLGSGATTHAWNNYSRAYEQAGRRLRSRGILAVAAAGNSGRTSRPYVGNPARCPSFMAVSSVDCARRRSPFSSYGPQVEICAPGSDVWSTYPPNGYRRLSGTSMATPHVAGVAALVKRRHPSWHGDRIRVHLWGTARDLGSAGRDWFYGYGLTNAYAAVR